MYQIYQLYHGENKLIFYEMIMMSALYYTNTFSCISIMLSHWNNNLRVDMHFTLKTLSWLLSK